MGKLRLAAASSGTEGSTWGSRRWRLKGNWGPWSNCLALLWEQLGTGELVEPDFCTQGASIVQALGTVTVPTNKLFHFTDSYNT